MPIYEYQCEACQDVIEAQQSLTDKPLTTCPACTGSLKKLISRSSFQLKGGGWYSDGYSGNSASASCPAASGDAAPACAAKESCACKCG
ncbi:MAG: zinc ribbon domain-containing protein [Proteobacteria bacterium]|nr:zinc ribbon domain-containing protein [Pseudomonadota bacterium]MBU1546561.1 zinc ribbon domain-containing protein [Pseudomonadota bacterium]MBU2618080.1 zinc ribbon domain-containing protein [Pseudomonadota bacterium]